mgnify:CR=1 FL=1
MVVELLVQRPEGPFQVGKIHHPACPFSDPAGDMHLDAERMTVQARAFVSFRYVGQAVSRLHLENSEYVHA